MLERNVPPGLPGVAAQLALMRQIDELLARFGKAQLAVEHATHCILRSLSQLTHDTVAFDEMQTRPTTESTFIVRTIPGQPGPHSAVDPRSTQDKWEAPATHGRPVPLQENRLRDSPVR